jgi:3-methyladenine DNA glycosylase AlkD
MTLDQTMARLEALGSEKIRNQNIKNGAGDNQFGVQMGDIRTLAKEIKANPDLANELWKTGNFDAMCLATLLMKPKLLSNDELEQIVLGLPVRDSNFDWLASWLTSNVVKHHPEKEALRQKWMTSDKTMLARTGWSLTADRVEKSPDGLDLTDLLTRIDNEMGNAPKTLQWTMNFTLAAIGINFPEHRARAIAIGEKIGAFRDYPVSKGCTSPFAPIWIEAMVSRKG